MGKYSRKLLWAMLLLLLVAANGAHGQWKIVVPKLLVADRGIGAMDAKSGIVWAGDLGNSLWSSTDTGKNWTQSVFTQTADDCIFDINFFDSQVGIIGAGDGVYLTTDGGKFWKNLIMGGWPYFISVAFGNSASNIYALDNADELYVTTNEGVSWKTVAFGGYEGLSVTLGEDGTIYVFSYPPINTGSNGWINSSSDGGQTWFSNTASVLGDSYTVTTDSFDSHRLYLANENYIARSDSFSRIFVSTDAGASWQADFTAPINVIAGNMTAGRTTMYAGTMDTTGVLCSVDRGQSWIRIGGPAIPVDSRNIVAMNDSEVFATDNSGNIWAGGYVPCAPFSWRLSADTLFQADSLYLCQNPLALKLFIRTSGCPFPQISSEKITGHDSNDYETTHRIDSLTGDDSLEVTFAPSDSGERHAQIEFHLTNGTQITVPLFGYGIPAAQLSLTSSIQNTDTLGATVSVPITINGLRRPEDVDLVLHYDGSLDYLGSFSPSGAKLDVAGVAWPGRSLLNIPGVAPGVIAGYAKFNAWNDSNRIAHATFDSMNVLTAISPCEYTLPEAATSTITAPSGCGTTMLSQWVHLGVQPKFVIQPNPTEGDVSISSSLDLGAVTIAIYDMLGSERSRWEENISGNTPLTLPLPEADGVYTLVVNCGAGRYNLRAVRHH